jgi:hypothetical protein
MENIVRTSKEPIVYLIPFADFWLKHWYLGGGAIFQVPMGSDFTVVPLVHTGWNVGMWECGQGRIGIDLGVEFSPTVSLIESSGEEPEDALGDALGSVFTTIFNAIKINLGVCWLLPL